MLVVLSRGLDRVGGGGGIISLTSQTSPMTAISTIEASWSLGEGNKYVGSSFWNQSCSLNTLRYNIVVL